MSPKKAGSKTGKVVFSAEEREAMREYVREKKSEGSKTDGTRDVLAKIAELKEPERSMAQRLHELITATAPELLPRTWYGMPAYARDGKVVIHFQSAQKFKTRYASLGFSDSAKLDDGAMWPVAFALKELTAKEAAAVEALVRKAVR